MALLSLYNSLTQRGPRYIIQIDEFPERLPEFAAEQPVVFFSAVRHEGPGHPAAERGDSHSQDILRRLL